MWIWIKRRRAAAAALALLACGTPACTRPSNDPDAYVGTWATRDGDARFTLRLNGDGSYTQTVKLVGDSPESLPPARGRWRLERGGKPAVLLDSAYWIGHFDDPERMHHSFLRLEATAVLGIVSLETPQLGPAYDQTR